jgi:hypothetical protein
LVGGEERGDSGGVGDGSGGLCGWAGVGVVEDDAGYVGGGRVEFGGAEGGVVAVHRGDAAEKELADVGDGDGVETRDAFAGELADEVAEERVDGVGRGEVFHVAEQLGGTFIVL